ncbi:MAG TPA: hypothetical protein VFB38_25280 [Chthonomonadaceae bacterium]|nr:hypothetical protein [Chthonomonadaceae bacterium]
MTTANTTTSRPLLWGNLLHLSYNMWDDHVHPNPRSPYVMYAPYLRFDESLWNDLLQQMAQAGMNLVVLDLGDGVRYESHPEIAVQNAWTPEKLKSELAKMRQLGLEPIPKLNFSTAHDAWLAEYSRMVSTPQYYAVCRDLIQEVIALFDRPRFFHLGMDEETCAHQRDFEYVVVRQKELWWRDLYFYIAQVEKEGVRPWIWSDYVWHHPDLFYQKMPPSVVQSNWYYESRFDAVREPGPPQPYDYSRAYLAYLDLAEHGYDQIPTGSNWSTPANFEATVAFCRQHIPAERLLGFLQTPWKPTLEACRQHHQEAIEQVERAMRLQ